MRRSLVGFAVLLALCGATAAFAATRATPTLHLGGTWKGTYSGAFSGNFTIVWTQNSRGVLSGSITLSSPQGKYGINGKVTKSAIKFGVVGAGATYKGSATTLKMSGTYQSPQGGGSWSAHKVLTPTKVKVKLK